MSKYGLIFDVDGVIADTEAVNARATIRVFTELFGSEGVEPEDFRAGLGRGAKEHIKAGARVHNLRLTPEQVRTAAQLRQGYFLEILSREQLPAFPGVMELINGALERDDFETAIATSGTVEKSRAVLNSVGVPYEKMVYVTGTDVKNKKPDPELFLTAANRMALEPARCVVIEDAPDGVLAANSAGVKCIAVTNSTSVSKLSKADLICESLKQIDIETIIQLIDTK